MWRRSSRSTKVRRCSSSRGRLSRATHHSAPATSSPPPSRLPPLRRPPAFPPPGLVLGLNLTASDIIADQRQDVVSSPVRTAAALPRHEPGLLIRCTPFPGPRQAFIGVLVAAVLCCCCCFALAARLLRTEKRFAALRRRSTFHDIVLASQVQTAGEVRGAPKVARPPTRRPPSRNLAHIADFRARYIY